MSLLCRGPLLLCCCLLPGVARADGGTVRFAGRAGDYQVTVFTAPTPLRAGPVDVSVLVQDAATGEPAADVSVTISLTPASHPEMTLHYLATRAAATNKLFHAAKFDLRGAGIWRMDVALAGPRGRARVGFDLEAAGPLPRWVELAFWIGWPVLPIVLFGMHQVLVRRRAKRTRHEGTSNRQRA